MSLKDEINITNPLISLENLNKYDELLQQKMIELIQAKTESFTVEDGLSIYASADGGQLPEKPTTDYKQVHHFNDIQKGIKYAKDVKIGDIIYLKTTDAPDYWVTNIINDTDGTPKYFGMAKLETQKIDLSVYATKDEVRENARLISVQAENINQVSILAGENHDKIVSLEQENDGIKRRISELENISIASVAQIEGLFK